MIDCAPISFLDAVGVKVLKQLVINFDKCDVQVLFAAMTGKTGFTGNENWLSEFVSVFS